jgi:hypothetical protein
VDSSAAHEKEQSAAVDHGSAFDVRIVDDPLG